MHVGGYGQAGMSHDMMSGSNMSGGGRGNGSFGGGASNSQAHASSLMGNGSGANIPRFFLACGRSLF